MNNPFNKPFNEWTIDDFQNALKITANKQAETIQIGPTSLNVTAHFSNDIVELERGETLPKPKDTKYTRMKAFHKELQAFINTLQGKNGRLDVKTIKRAIDRLPRTHAVHTTYRAYLEKCRWKQRQQQLEKWGTIGSFWDLTDYNRISNHLKYMKGYYTELSHKARLACYGGIVSVYKRYITIH
jgi:hypothetical protein